MSDLPGTPTDVSNLQKLADDPKKFNFIGDMNRPGVKLFFVKLEYTYYDPNKSSRNDLFGLNLLKWPENFPMLWGICSIPIEEKDLAIGLLQECGLADGVPTMIGDGKTQVFPMCSERVFTLENVSDHPIYKNELSLAENLADKEARMIDDIIRRRNN